MFGTSCYLGLLRLYPSSFNSLPLSCKQIDSLPFVLHCSAVISVFVKNQLHEVNLRLETLVEEREYEVAVLHREVSDPATGLENKASALAEEQRRLVGRRRGFVSKT